MGSSNSTPLLAHDQGDIVDRSDVNVTDEGSNMQVQKADVDDDGDVISPPKESCWRYLLRKFYSALGYEQVATDVSRKRRRSPTPLSEEKTSCGDQDQEEGDAAAAKHVTGKLARLDSAEETQVSGSEVELPPDTPASTPAVVSVHQVVDETISNAQPSLQTGNLAENTPSLNMEFMDFPFLRDEAALSYVTSALTMFVMRGLPGSGKSTVVSVLLRTFPGAQVRSVTIKYFFISFHIFF